MELKSANCPNCGGKLELNPEIEKGICVYCGAEIIVADAIQKFKGEISGIATIKSSILRAEQQLEDGDFDAAIKLFKHIIEVDPINSEAFWGLFECELASAEYYLKLNSFMKRSGIEYFESVNSALEKYAKRAIKYASSERKSEFEAKAAEIKANAQAKYEEIEYNNLSASQKFFNKYKNR